MPPTGTPANGTPPTICGPSAEPRRNLAFGAGIHHCIGAPLARLEGRIGLRLLLAQMPEYKIVTAERAHDINLHMYKSVVLEPTPLALTK